MEFRPCLAPCERHRRLPRRVDCRPRAVAPAPPEGDASAASQHGPRRTVGCRWIRPERRSHRVGPNTRRCQGADVIATHLRRDSCATQRRSEERRPVVRARAPHPSAVARVHDGETARRGRSRPEARSSACHSRAPRRMRRRTQQAESRRIQPVGEPEAPPGGGPLAARGSRDSSKLEGGLGPDSHRVHRDGHGAIRRPRRLSDPEESESVRRSAQGAVGTAHPTCGGDPPRAPKCPCRDGPWSIPGSPDRSRACFRSERAEAPSEPRPV